MRVVIADLRGERGFVNKDTIVGGFGSRFQGFSRTTRWIERMRRLYQNIPSIHAAYLAAIFEGAGHEVVFSDGPLIEGDQALVLTSIVDYRHELEWAATTKRRYGMKVGLFGAMATHATDLLAGQADVIIRGEPEEAAFRMAAGEMLSGVVRSSPIMDLDSLPFPAWHRTMKGRRRHSIGRTVHATGSAFPVLSSRSCPEFCTYCPHRTTAPYRARQPQNVLAELEELYERYGKTYVVFRDPLFTEDRDRSMAIAEGILSKGLPVQFECETRLDDLDTALLDLLYRAGLRAITFGVESVSASTLKRVGRRPIPPVHQKEIVNHCKRLGIMTHGFYLFGFLDDTADSIRATIGYAVELDSTFALFKVLTPYPGTPILKQLAPLIVETDLEKFDGYTLTFNHPHLTAEEMRFLLGAAFTRFYVRASWIQNYLGLRPYEWIQRLDECAGRHQAAIELAFLRSQESKVQTP
jgi:radical SAM superfamily enzyme YgiQ (UPF0313 family)